MTPLILICAGFPEKYISNFDLNLLKFKLSSLKKQIFSMLLSLKILLSLKAKWGNKFATK